MWSGSSRSPPPLQHPIPTHPHYIPEPPDTPVSSSGTASGSTPDNYMRFSSDSQRPPIESILNPQQIAAMNTGLGFGATGASGAQMHPSQMGGMGGSTYRAQAPAGYGQHNPPNTYGYGHGGQPPPGQPPSFGGMPWGVNDATAQLGLQLGQNAIHAGQEYMQKNLGSFGLGRGMAKRHFEVDNSYVLRKLGVMVWPWRKKGWNRRVVGEGQDGTAVQFAPPKDDLNAPDLYIPSMAIVTYILLYALRVGLDPKSVSGYAKGGYGPEYVLAAKTSTALTIIILETLFIKLGCYTLDVEGNSQLLDILSYTSYKFVPSTILLLLRILKIRGSIYWLAFLYLFGANGFFLLRSLRSLILSSTTPASGSSQASQIGASRHQTTLRSYRVMFLFAVAVGQVPGMWFLS